MKIKVDVSNGNNVFFTSDTHFFHKNIIKYDKRPFMTDNEPDVNLMNETIVNNWNSVVSKKDTVFFLGDLAVCNWENARDVVNQLNGTIHFIMGNHDNYQDIKSYKKFNTINDYVDLTIKSDVDATYTFALFHYPIYSWNRIHYGNAHLHGHCHHNLHHDENMTCYSNRKVLDVGCNGYNYTPISYKEVLEKLDLAS